MTTISPPDYIYSFTISKEELSNILDTYYKDVISFTSIEKYAKIKNHIIKSYDECINKTYKYVSGEWFRYNIPLGNNTITVHFCITYAHKYMRAFLHNEINICRFSDNVDSDNTKQDIRFSKIDDDCLSYLNIVNTPVFLVPYEYECFRYLVIDGNHRITCAMNNDIKSLNAFIVPTNYLKYLLPNNFEYWIYMLNSFAFHSVNQGAFPPHYQDQ